MKAIEITSRGLRVFLKMVCVFLLLSSQAWAALEVTASSFTFNSFTLAQRVDSSNSLTFDAVTRTLTPTPVSNAFVLGYLNRQGIWHTASLRNTTEQAVEYVLYNKNWFSFREVDVFITREDGTVVQSFKAGYGREGGRHTGDLPGFYGATLAPDAQHTLHI
ncbi:MAG: hypothetical protein K9K38_06820, partial [Rhodoferax sp.]|nr:hypothetical protein [Rhodoferax sp.]